MKKDGRPTKREVALGKMRQAGYENDRRTYVRLLVESRINRQALNAAWQAGEKLRAPELSA
jgi:hypothetical protein